MDYHPDNEHIYMQDNEISFGRESAPTKPRLNYKEDSKISSPQRVAISKINGKLRIIIAVMVAFFIVTLTLFGVQFYWISRQDIQNIDVRDETRNAVSALERNLMATANDLKNESRNATSTLERNIMAAVNNDTETLQQSDVELKLIVKSNERNIEMLGKELDKMRVDCTDVDPRSYISGNQSRGAFQIYVSGYPTDVFCDLSTDGGGWTVIQRRMDGSENFFRNHADYVTGFGNVTGEHWIGLATLHVILQSSKDFELRIDMEDWEGVRKTAKYSKFDVGRPEDDFILNVAGYSGTATDSFTIHNAGKFSTKDHDVDRVSTNCAALCKGAWWYTSCHSSNLNGHYYIGGTTDSYADGINWRTWKGYYYSLKFVEMKIRPTG